MSGDDLMAVHEWATRTRATITGLLGRVGTDSDVRAALVIVAVEAARVRDAAERAMAEQAAKGARHG